jgi:hypothetical protein
VVEDLRKNKHSLFISKNISMFSMNVCKIKTLEQLRFNSKIPEYINITFLFSQHDLVEGDTNELSSVHYVKVFLGVRVLPPGPLFIIIIFLFTPAGLPDGLFSNQKSKFG